jgi:hypothetical protein
MKKRNNISNRIITDFEKFNESFTEFNLQRFGAETSAGSISGVDDPQLSLNAFDKNQDAIRQAMARINDIMYKLSGSNAYAQLRGKLALEDQDIKSMKVLRIIKSNNIFYDVYLSFVIGDKEYWGVINNIMSAKPELESEVFKDYDLYQAKEWIIKIKGLIIKTVKEWLKPEPGNYKLINDEIICYSVETGKQLIMDKGLEIEVVRSHPDKIIVRHDSDTYNLVGDNYIYFNWWFEKID